MKTKSEKKLEAEKRLGGNEDLSFRFATIHEIIQHAHSTVSQGVWDYMAGATDSETTLRRNRHGYDKLGLRPRAMKDVTHFDPSTEFFGKKVRMPLILAPVGSIESFAAGGGAVTAKAAERFNVFDMLSSRCAPGLEEVANSADNPRIFQLYVRGDDNFVDDYVQRAIDNGYDGFAVTVDSASYSRRERDLANRFMKKWRSNVSDEEHIWQAKWTWDNVKRFKDKWDIPFVLKGIGDVEDAARAAQEGVDAIYISNHGGRALDRRRARPHRPRPREVGDVEHVQVVHVDRVVVLVRPRAAEDVDLRADHRGRVSAHSRVGRNQGALIRPSAWPSAKKPGQTSWPGVDFDFF